MNLSGSAFVTPAKMDDEWYVRVSIGVEATERAHLERLVDLLDHYSSSQLSS